MVDPTVASQRLVPDPATRQEPFALTEMQQAYYVGRLTDGGAGAHIYLEFDVDSIDLDLMERSWNRVVAETDMLRAVVRPDGRMRVRAEVEPYRLRVLDLTAVTEERRTLELAASREELSEFAFDPHEWPPFAIRVALLPGGGARVCFAIDEMVADGPSVSLLIQRWHRFYRDAPCPPPPAVGFRDYANALAAQDEGPGMARALAYWQNKLAGVDLTAPSPLARTAPEQGGRLRRLTLTLPEAGWSRVKAHAQDWKATPSALLLGMYAVALRREADVDGPMPLVLTTYNRQPLHPDVRRMIGPFISTVIFLAPDARGRIDAAVAATQRQLWEDLEHGFVSGVRVLRERARLDPGQRNAAIPLVFTSVLGSLAGADDEDRDGWAARVDTEASLNRTPGVFLEANAQEHDGDLRLSFDHVPSAVDTDMVQRAFRALERALTTLAELPAGTEAPDIAALYGGSPRSGLPLTEIQSAYLVGRMSGGDETKVYQEFLLLRHDADRLEHAWRRLVEHHPMLRAVVHADGTLSIAESVDHSVPRHDHTGREDAEAAIGEVRARMTAASMPLDQGPMFAFEISVLPEGRLVLHTALDLLIADPRSLGLIFEQLFRLHDGEPGVLDTPADGYPRYLVERAERARGPRAEPVRAEWRAKFEALPPGPPIEGRPGAARVHRRFDLDTWARLRERAGEIGVPADILLLTAYCDVLREEFSAEPFTIVVVSWDRPHAADHLVGDFTRLSWLVVDDELPTGAEDRARAVWARVRSDLDRTEVLDGVGPMRQRVLRSQGRLRLPVVFTRLPASETAAPPAGVEVRYSQSQTAQVSLDHVPLLVGDSLVCQWDAMADALPDGRLDRLFERYAERVRALAGESGTDEWALPPQLESALAEHAGRPAVRFDGETLTYRELDRRTARMARHLIRLGCRPGDHIGVHMDRSADLVVALLAIVRAGAAYVPIDPANPPDRVRFLLDDSQVRLVIADAARCALPEEAGLPVVCPERDRAAIGAEPDGPLDARVGPLDPVYMIYTSGTTGQPKGCRNSQRGLTNRLRWMQDRFPLGPGDRVAQKTPYGFDVSVWEFFWPLLTGACVVVARPGGHLDPGYLARLFRTEGVTVTHFVPSMLGMFLPQPGAAECRSLRYVFASGEALPAPTAARFFEVLPGTELHNLYGPTEAAIDVTHWECRRDWTEPTIPIGRPIANTRVHVLDEDRRPVPAGAEGEIYLDGYGVALGYHRRPELEEERFVPSPFADSIAPRLYRTGDRGRLGPDGVLYYLGRTDNQFKIRGLRVEGEEIEAALVAVPGVVEARVLPVDDPAGGQALAALCVADGPEPKTAVIREHLARTLPAYLLPSRIRFVPRLPLTPNGKLDRGAAADLLANPAAEATAPAASAVTGPSATETPVRGAATVTAEDIAAHSATLLGVDRVGVDDDLFELGATSFTMIRLAQTVLEHHQVEIPVEVLIERPTPRAISDGMSAPAKAAPSGLDLRVALDAEAKAEFKKKRVSLRALGDRHARVPLGKPDRAAIFATTSVREFTAEPIPFATMSELLTVFIEGEIDGRPSRQYPSAGGFYPVQTYVYVKPGRVAGVGGGVYYLDPAGASLVALEPDAVIGTDTQVLHNRAVLENAAFGIFLISTPGAIVPAYGERLSERYTTIEAGHLAQIAIERSMPLGLGLCAVGDMAFPKVRPYFALDPGQELIVSLWGGGLPETRRDRYRELAGTPRNGGAPKAANEPIAIVGFAARLPGTPDHDGLGGIAALLACRTSAIGPVPSDRWPRGSVRTGRAGAAVGAYLDDVAHFEAGEFGIGADEAAAMDPQERLLLQTVRACLEDAAVTPDRLAASGPVGVFTGAMWQDYTIYGTQSHTTFANRGGLAHRVSHAFDLTGPSVVLDAACVSGLAAIDAACKAIRGGECTAAVAAAANLVLHPHHLDFLAEVGLLAEGTDSCPFTENASGWIVGEGVASILLKPLSAALADGDPIHAVVSGSAVRHSGTTREYGMPNAARLQDAMRSALADAGTTASGIGYVEAAASGAALADALEMRGLDSLFSGRTEPVPVGSVKATLGHMEAASVFGQLAKVIVQFQQEQIFPTLVTGERNPMIDTDRVRLTTEPTSWDGRERRVLMNNFAGSGACGSLVVEAPPAAERQDTAQPEILPLSADDPELLATAAARLADRLEGRGDLPLAAVAAGLRARRHRPCRAAVIAGPGEAIGALRELAGKIRAGDTGHLVARAATPVPPTGWLDGGEPDWPEPAPRRVHLPPTPVRNERYWLDTPAPALEPEPEPATTTALDCLIRLVAEEGGVDAAALTGDTDVIALGVDSRRLLRVARRIEVEYERRVPLEFLYEAATLGELATLIFGDAPVPEPAGPAALSDAEIDLLDEETLDRLLTQAGGAGAAPPRH